MLHDTLDRAQLRIDEIIAHSKNLNPKIGDLVQLNKELVEPELSKDFKKLSDGNL